MPRVRASRPASTPPITPTSPTPPGRPTAAMHGTCSGRARTVGVALTASSRSRSRSRTAADRSTPSSTWATGTSRSSASPSLPTGSRSWRSVQGTAGSARSSWGSAVTSTADLRATPSGWRRRPGSPAGLGRNPTTIRTDPPPLLNSAFRGAIAQLEEHLHGMQGVRGSSPRSSTNRDETADPLTPRRRGGGCPVSEDDRDRYREHQHERPDRDSRPDRALRPDRDRAALAEALVRALDVPDGPLRHRASQVLPAHHVPVSVGRHPYRPLVHHHADRRDSPFPSDARRECV